MSWLVSYSYQVGDKQGTGDAFIDFELEEPLTKALVEKIRALVIGKVSTPHRKASVVITNLIRLEVP